MKKFTKLTTIVAMAAIALSTFSCANNTKYTAEKNIQGLCPELVKEIKADVTNESEAKQLISDILVESMRAVMANLSFSSSRATAKKTEDAKKQIDKFILDLTAAGDCFDENHKMIKDINFKGNVDIVDFGFEDTLEEFISIVNSQNDKKIDQNNKKYPTESEKKIAKEKKHITIDKIKEGVGSDTYSLLCDSIKVDRLLLKAEIALKDTDKNKTPDYFATKDDVMIAVTAKNVANIIQLTSGKENETNFYFPVKAFAVSEEAKGNVEANFAEESKTITVNKSELSNDTQFSLAAVNNNGLGAYVTVKVASNITNDQIQSFCDYLISAIQNDNSNINATMKELSSDLGVITFTFNNGKKETFTMTTTFEDLLLLTSNSLSGRN